MAAKNTPQTAKKATSNKASVKVTTPLTGAAASMSGATAAKGLLNGKTDAISKTGKKKTTSNKSSSSSTSEEVASAPSSAPAADITGEGMTEVLLSFKSLGFFANASKIVGFNDLNINSSCETEEKTDNGEKYTALKNRKGFEITFKAYLDARLGIEDVRGTAMAIAMFASNGETGYIYSRGEKLVAACMMATSAKIKDIRMTPKGIWISCSIDLTFKSCGKLEWGGSAQPASSESSSGGGGDGNGGRGRTYTATVSYSTGSGSVATVSATSTISHEDALKKAYAKVPNNAKWAHEDETKANNPYQPNKEAKINTAAQQQSTAKSKSDSTTTDVSVGLFDRLKQIAAANVNK